MAAQAQGSYSITVRAIDGVTSVLAKINKGFAAQQKGFTKIQQSGRKFGDELRRLGRITGITSLTRGVRSFATGVAVATARTARFVGKLLSISTAASAAGIATLVNAFSEYNQHLTANSKLLGISAADLERWQMVGRLAGVSAEDMTSGMLNLGNTMQDALVGRAPLAAAAFRMLGIAIQGASPYIAKTADAIMPQLADAIQRMEQSGKSAAEELELLSMLHIPAGMLPLLRLGAAGMADYSRQAAKYSTVSADGLAAANKFRVSQALLGLATTKLANTFSEALSPALVFLSDALRTGIDWLLLWIKTDRASKDSKLGFIVAETTRAFDKYWPILKHAATATNEFVKEWGGWERLLKGFGVLLLASVAVPILLFLTLPIMKSLKFIGYLGRDLMLLVGVFRWVGAAILTTTGPIGLFIAAVIAAGLVVYEIHKHWDHLGPWFQSLWGSIKTYALEAWGAIKEAAPVIFSDVWSLIKQTWNDFWAWMKTDGPSAFGAAGQAVVDVAPKVFGAIWDVLGFLWSAEWTWITRDGPRVLLALLNALLAFIKPIAKALWKPIGDEWDDVVKGIGEKIDIIKANFTRLKIWFARLASQMMTPFKVAYNEMASFYNKFADTSAGKMLGLGHMDEYDTGTPQDRPFTGNEKDLSNEAMDYFTGQGWSREQAAGIVGNLRQESGYNPQSGAGTAHQGIAQWSAGRQKDIEDHFGKPLMSMSYAEQLAAVQWELTQGKYKSVGNDLRRMTTTGDSAAVIDHGYESPGNYGVEDPTRAANAKRSLHDYPIAPLVKPQASAAGTGQINVAFNGFPRGLFTTSASGSGLKLATATTAGPLFG